MRDLLISATAGAVALAKGRSDDQVTPDDLLLGALHAAARLGVASFGPITIDLSDRPSPPTTGGSATQPRYSQASAEIFDRASAVARADGESKVRLVHLLAALGDSDSPLMTEIRDRHGFTAADWRSALASWDASRERRPDPTRLRGSVMSVEDAAEALGVHPQTIRGYIRSAKLPAYRIAGERAIRVFASDLYGLLEPLEPTRGAEED